MLRAEAEIEIIRGEIEAAAEAVIAASLKGLELIEAHKSGERATLDGMEAIFCAILEACAFQDLTGQRLSKLVLACAGVAMPRQDTLLNGPASPGVGLDQDTADRLLQAS